jgi:hypothetical protein
VVNCVQDLVVLYLEWGHFDWTALLLWAVLALINVWSMHMLLQFQHSELSKDNAKYLEMAEENSQVKV